MDTSMTVPGDAADEALRAHVAAGGVVEHAHEMSPGYRHELVKMLTVAGDTELRSVPMLMSYLDVGVPPRYLRPILSIAQDELGHAHLDYRLLEVLGEDVDALVFERDASSWSVPYLFDMPIVSWTEIAVVEGLGEFLGGLLVRNILSCTSFAPWRRALAKVDIEENFHVKFGKALMVELAADADGRAGLQRAVDWMFPLLLEFMGPPSRPVDPQLDYRLKARSVDELREEYLRFAVPLCERLSLRVPAHHDADLGHYVLDFPFPCAFDLERREWDFGRPVEWSEVYSRWRARAPLADRHVAWLQSGHRSVRRALSRPSGGMP